MATIIKLVKKMLCRPAEMRFKDADKVLRYFDWQLINIDGSHFHYEKGNCPDFIIVIHRNKVCRLYIDRIIGFLNLEEWYEHNKK